MLRDVEIEEVEKMLQCGDPDKGFATYRCPDCGNIQRIPFTCKSRICTSCGKKHADKWAIQLSMELYDVSHRHIVFTIPDVLRDVFEDDRTRWKIMMDSVNQTMKQMIGTRRKDGDVTPGVICILHPFGKDMKFNPHVHVLVTEGGLDRKSNWVEMRFFPYESLRKIWQYHLLTNLKENLPKTRKNAKMINHLFKKYPNGFYIYAKSRIDPRNGRGVSRYIGRYVRHPAIAESRITGYDGETVTFYYNDEQGNKIEVTIPVFEFIEKIIRLIPDRNFKMIRYYGLYARNKKRRVHKIMHKLRKYSMKKERHLKDRLRRLDAVICERCGSRMELIEKRYPG